MSNKFITWLIVAVVLIGGIWYFGRGGIAEAPKQSTVPYSLAEYKISFEHPSRLYLKEVSNAGTPESPQLAVVLVEDTQMNRDILDGKSELGGEGPTAIAVEVYQNPDGLEAEAWAKQGTNWTVSDEKLTPIVVAGQKGISFNWDGLYQGKSLIVTKGTLAYVFSVTWLTPEDQLIKDFDMVLNSVKLAD